jgi:hypothetical protein
MIIDGKNKKYFIFNLCSAFFQTSKQAKAKQSKAKQSKNKNSKQANETENE